ncbi:2-hydroxyacyl-CoA dehydratase family protein [Pseudoduganella sp. SL102]|uniref:2-hydroxyacyl-CoA dehydratase family protein n=1 Tax=Pseudoduganella sp. SL102 TaxID=2995154 RepID=UPI00248C728D|nr:2-hydroxyacyl-CoA dehydratase family protein [Pseudoduganella sp. SL102]WBS00691.1 2-hydroxyacyl-CoA dehydratase family protein [Pseudoduganella sp. SL102]
MSPSGPLDALRRAYDERLAGATRARAAGTPVVAYLGNATPVELIVAAGAHPLLMSGDPREDTPLAERFLDDDFDGDLRSVYQRVVTGHYNLADLIVIPRSSNGYLYLYYFLLETRRMLPETTFPEVVLFDVLHTPYLSTGQYVLGRLAALKTRLEKLGGRAIDAAGLRQAIAVVNGSRAALQALNSLRREGRIAGADMLRATGAAGYAGPAAAAAMLRDACDEAARMPLRTGMRLMVKGAPHDNAAFYELVESLNAHIVADDHVSGERGFEHLVDEGIEPLAALAQHYHLHTPGIRSFPQAAQDRRFLEIVEQARVEGVVFFHDEFDDTLGWDYPEQKRLLEARGIPAVLLQRQSYRAPDRAAQQAAIRALLEERAP